MLDQAFEQHIANLSNGHRPQGWADTHLAYRQFRADLRRQLAETETELAQPMPALPDTGTAYRRVREATLRILDEAAAAAGALPPKDISHQPTAPVEPTVAMPEPAQPDETTATPDQHTESEPAAEPKNTLTESWISLPEFHRLCANMSQAPAAILFPGSPPEGLSNWTEIVTATANHLIDAGKIKIDDCPIVVPPGKTPLVTTEAKRDNRNKLRTLPLRDGMHIANSHHRNGAAHRAISMLRHFDVDPEQCRLMVLTADLPQPE